MSMFREDRRMLTPYEKETKANIKAHANSMAYVIEKMDIRGSDRYKALAIARLEEAVMWAVKGISSE